MITATVLFIAGVAVYGAALADEGVQEYLTANNYQFLKDGTIFIY